MIIIFLLILVLVLEVFPFIFVKPSSRTINIGSGTTTKSIALMLKKDKLIIDPYGFSFLVYVAGAEGRLKSGMHNLEAVHNTFELIKQLEQGGLPEEISVTIPEGYNVKEIAQKLFEAGVVDDKTKFIEEAQKDEGYLFPDTYNFILGSSNSNVISKMKSRFYEVLPKDYEKSAQTKGLSVKQAIILASIIEKEIVFNKDRPIAASVFLNRLKVGMPLQSDATIFYILSSHKEYLSADDYKIDSPYNTYKYTGLPLGPISNPGLDSIEAVINAPETDYYYFITKPDGEAVFEKTLEEHNKDVAKYYGY
ncbi:MAG: endolytic transglycosylase MltG [Caldisericaceae bacterium]